MVLGKYQTHTALWSISWGEAKCYLQLCAAAAAGERPSSACAST